MFGSFYELARREIAKELSNDSAETVLVTLRLALGHGDVLDGIENLKSMELEEGIFQRRKHQANR